jgi:hypothetical protein
VSYKEVTNEIQYIEKQTLNDLEKKCQITHYPKPMTPHPAATALPWPSSAAAIGVKIWFEIFTI